MSEGLPFERVFDLADLGKAGATVEIVLSDLERERLARWAGVVAVDAFKARIALTKRSPTRYALEAKLEVAIEQACVVTLEPVRSKIERVIAREMYLVSPVKRALPKEATVSPASDDDVTQEIESLDYDLAEPLLEELILAIDPYPRAEGVSFEPPADSGSADEGPFAALKALKSKG